MIDIKVDVVSGVISEEDHCEVDILRSHQEFGRLVK